MKVRAKLLFSFSSVLGVLVIAASYAAYVTYKIDQDRQAASDAQEKILNLTHLRAEVRNYLLLHFRIDSQSDLVATQPEVSQSLQNIKAALSKVQNQPSVNEAFESLALVLQENLQFINGSNHKLYKQNLVNIQKIHFIDRFLKVLGSVIQEKVVDFQQKNEMLKSRILHLRVAGWVFALIALLFALYYTFSLARALGQRLDKLEEATRQISAGNYNFSIPLEGTDEFSALSAAFNKMADSLREAQSQLLAQQEVVVATSKMSALGEMAGGIAHEINNPLATIQLLADQLHDPSRMEPARVAETAKRIQLTVDRIANIIKGLRSFVRNAEHDPFEAVAIQEIIRDTLNLCEQRIRSKRIQVHIEMSQEPVLLECRATQVSQVLLNLISNASDAVEECSEKWIQIRVTEQPTNVVIQVIDSGSGIPESLHGKVMTPFFTTKAVGKGTGLGLSISRNIVHSHQGELRLDAASAHTTFVVTLPKSHHAKLKSA